jgi:hypothetical protein
MSGGAILGAADCEGLLFNPVASGRRRHRLNMHIYWVVRLSMCVLPLNAKRVLQLVGVPFMT